LSIAHCQSISQFIIYACPQRELNTQLETYFTQSRQRYGKNAAHQYMPHCTLTGFFSDQLDSIPVYIQALEQAYIAAKNNLPLKIAIKQLTFRENWHGLELQADNLKKLIADFSENENSRTRQEELRLKDWLHLSLAYNFEPKFGQELKNLATEIIDPQADVDWELRFYQKNADFTWTCLKSWKISN
jgi:hypothetical protein